MNWYYLEGSEQRGPVTDADLETLARAGRVGPDTLVWHEGMAEWLPCAQANGPSAAAPLGMAGPVNAPPGQALCAECGRAFPPEEVIRHGNQFICAACKPVFLQKLKEGVAPPGALNYAGFWIRVLAYIIDLIILDIVIVTLSIAIRAMLGTSLNPLVPSIAASLIGLPVNLALAGFYQIYLVGKYGATPGKMALKLRIVQPDGSPIGYATACGRMFAIIVSFLCCYVGVLMVAWDSEKRGLHDRMCGTRVIQI
jgi:uncharacterized RDD family membrane protein YckC